MQFFQSVQGAPAPVGPYSAAVRLENIVFLAGQIGLNPADGKLVEGGIEAETRQVLENLTAVLKGVGSSWSDVCMTSVFLADISYGGVVNRLYETYIDSNFKPARQTVAVKDLPLGALVEISLIARAG